MAAGKEIRNQIKSIKSTQKITKAMEMVAASKMRRAQVRMNAARPYADKIAQVISHMAHAQPEYRHPFLIERPDVKRVGYLIISTDRGLCGGLNSNMFRAVLQHMRQWQSSGRSVGIDVAAIGQKAMVFFRRLNLCKLVATETHLGDVPDASRLLGPITVMIDAYLNGQLDRVYLVGNHFVNTMSQKATITQLLPGIPPAADADEQPAHNWDYIYEPDAKEILDLLLMRYVETRVYRTVVENIACEMAARMVAMKAATDNAGNLINELQLVYNKTRQAAITKEIAEIVGGAAAV